MGVKSIILDGPFPVNFWENFYENARLSSHRNGRCTMDRPCSLVARLGDDEIGQWRDHRRSALARLASVATGDLWQWTSFHAGDSELPKLWKTRVSLWLRWTTPPSVTARTKRV